MMEGVGLGGRRSGNAPAAILLLFTCVLAAAAAAAAAASSPSPTQRVCALGEFPTEDGFCCNKCSPGFKLVETCRSDHHRTKCVACPDGQFQDAINYHEKCRRCRQCRAARHEVEVSACRRDRNAVCGCEDGYYRVDIDRYTSECRACKKCGTNEREKLACTQESNTECVCKENHYRVQNHCSPCRNCSADCSLHCSSPPPPPPPPPRLPPLSTEGRNYGDGFLSNMVIGGVLIGVALVLLVAIVTNMIIKRSAHRELLPRPTADPSEDSSEPCKEVLITNEDPAFTNMDHQSSAPQQEVPNLPDCIPLEIKISDLIYTVLDLVPVLRVKQLVRSLGVKDSDIEQAELDYRPCREAHYQMLRQWAERGGRGGGGGGGGMLHRPLVLELLERLWEMQLGHAAEQLQTKYAIQ